jgi:predicted HTH transcriptional regulator
MNAFLSTITETSAPARPASIEDLIREGESEELEYKSTLRWDIEKKTVSKVMEEAIVKAVAAFSNGRRGGTLIVGVNDDGEVLGLEHDYVSLRGDRDEFELHLRTILIKQLGAPLVTTRVKVTFPVADGREICQIDISPSDQPVFIETTDKNGQRVERFYVRSGNSSRDFSPSEATAYVRERFR